jgi:hypothetical protein
MRSVIMGMLMVAGGASGQFVLIGTHSSTALAMAGVVTVSFGLFQVLTAAKHKTLALQKAEVRIRK